MDIIKDSDRIQKLLRLALDTRAFEEEARTAGRKAMELIDRHDLHGHYADEIKRLLDIETARLRKSAAETRRRTLREALDEAARTPPPIPEPRRPWSQPISEPSPSNGHTYGRKRAEWGSRQGRITTAHRVREIIAVAKKRGYTRQATAYLVERDLGLSLRDARAYIWYNWDKV